MDANGNPLNGNITIGTINTHSNLDVFGTTIIGDTVGERIILGLDYYGGELGLITTGDDVLAVKYYNRFEYGGGIPGSGRLVVTQAGNVGVGTTNPDEKLAVNGKIHTKEVRVDLIGWPDYVFDENYDLPSLREVEKYIKENGHLENIQSTEEVEANGVLLGEMNKKLLEKIEELTLYLIQQNKDIDELKKQVEFLMQKQ